MKKTFLSISISVLLSGGFSSPFAQNLPTNTSPGTLSSPNLTAPPKTTGGIRETPADQETAPDLVKKAQDAYTEQKNQRIQLLNTMVNSATTKLDKEKLSKEYVPFQNAMGKNQGMVDRAVNSDFDRRVLKGSRHESMKANPTNEVAKANDPNNPLNDLTAYVLERIRRERATREAADDQIEKYIIQTSILRAAGDSLLFGMLFSEYQAAQADFAQTACPGLATECAPTNNSLVLQALQKAEAYAVANLAMFRQTLVCKVNYDWQQELVDGSGLVDSKRGSGGYTQTLPQRDRYTPASFSDPGFGPTDYSQLVLGADGTYTFSTIIKGKVVYNKTGKARIESNSCSVSNPAAPTQGNFAAINPDYLAVGANNNTYSDFSGEEYLSDFMVDAPNPFGFNPLSQSGLNQLRSANPQAFAELMSTNGGVNSNTFRGLYDMQKLYNYTAGLQDRVNPTSGSLFTGPGSVTAGQRTREYVDITTPMLINAVAPADQSYVLRVDKSAKTAYDPSTGMMGKEYATIERFDNPAGYSLMQDSYLNAFENLDTSIMQKRNDPSLLQFYPDGSNWVFRSIAGGAGSRSLPNLLAGEGFTGDQVPLSGVNGSSPANRLRAEQGRYYTTIEGAAGLNGRGAEAIKGKVGSYTGKTAPRTLD